MTAVQLTTGELVAQLEGMLRDLEAADDAALRELEVRIYYWIFALHLRAKEGDTTACHALDCIRTQLVQGMSAREAGRHGGSQR